MGVTFSTQNIEEIIVAEDNPYFSSLDGVLFNDDRTILLAYPAAKESDSYTVPESVTEIKESAFYAARNVKSAFQFLDSALEFEFLGYLLTVSCYIGYLLGLWLGKGGKTFGFVGVNFLILVGVVIVSRVTGAVVRKRLQ